MAETVTWDGLRELAEFQAEKGYAISLYVDLDPSIAPTAAAPPIAQTCRVRARPRFTSAMWPHAGTASVNPMAPIEATSPICAGLKPRAARMTGMNG